MLVFEKEVIIPACNREEVLDKAYFLPENFLLADDPLTAPNNKSLSNPTEELSAEMFEATKSMVSDRIFGVPETNNDPLNNSFTRSQIVAFIKENFPWFLFDKRYHILMRNVYGYEDFFYMVTVTRGKSFFPSGRGLIKVESHYRLGFAESGVSTGDKVILPKQ